MERESFEDHELAGSLNRHFVAIKVDREERPDIDAIYMAVCQVITGQGGWPLTVIMTPDKHPFFAGTYFPKTSNRGMPGLLDILEQVAQKWEHARDKLTAAGEKITLALDTTYFRPAQGEIAAEALDKAYEYFAKNFDRESGGFGGAPKFPTPHNLGFLLRYWRTTGKAHSLEMVEKTLDGMARGGMYDHIGFGFSRYSTDRKWLVPHFEKMLYDNALLAITYLETFQATGKPAYAKTAREIFTYVLRDMTAPEGGFYSAEDADSEGLEGLYYLWTPAEVTDVLGEAEGTEFCRVFDITRAGNFEEKNIPNLIKGGGDDQPDRFPSAKAKLLAHREQRIHPHKDDKILTAWNGLMIAALAFGSRVLGEPAYAEAAKRAAGFIKQRLVREDGRLLARFREGEAAYPAYADDYAFLIWALIELYEATFEQYWLQWALELNSDLLKYFWDEADGGLFLYGSDSEQLITRPKEIYDGALPSANSAAALNWLRLGRLTGRDDLESRARELFKVFGGTINESPMGHTFLLMAVQLDRSPAVDVALVGDPSLPGWEELQAEINRNFNPELLVVAALPAERGHTADLLETLGLSNPAGGELKLPWLEGHKPVNGKATAYVCRDYACRPPVTEPAELAELL